MQNRQLLIEECDVPARSVLDARVVKAAFFRDAYRLPLAQSPQAGVVDIFFGVFGHHPLWMKRVLLLRNHLAALCGLEVAAAAEIMKPDTKQSWAVGDKIGPWPIFSLTPNELVAGRDNKHLDFRLSVLKEEEKEEGEGMTHVVISTVCTTHNAFGKIYLFFIIPFHRWGVKQLLSRAIAAGRL